MKWTCSKCGQYSEVEHYDGKAYCSDCVGLMGLLRNMMGVNG